MKQIFNNYEIVISTEDSFIENRTISLTVYECKTTREKGKNITRKVRFDKDAGDLYINFKNKKYFYHEFK